MAIMLLSIITAMVFGCVTWLFIGDRFPLNKELKFPSLNNIVIYTLLMILPIYITIFVLF